MRLKARCGPKKAVIAVAAAILTTIYHMLADGSCYQDVDGRSPRNPTCVAAKSHPQFGGSMLRSGQPLDTTYVTRVSG